GDERLAGVGADKLGAAQDLGHAEGIDEGGVLDHGRGLVRPRRNSQAQRLRQNDIADGLAAVHADGTRGGHLPTADRAKGAPEDLELVGAADNAQGKGAGPQGREIHGPRDDEVEDEEQHDRRHPAQHRAVDADQRGDEAPAINAQDGQQYAENKAQRQRNRNDLQGDEQALGDVEKGIEHICGSGQRRAAHFLPDRHYCICSTISSSMKPSSCSSAMTSLSASCSSASPSGMTMFTGPLDTCPSKTTFRPPMSSASVRATTLSMRMASIRPACRSRAAWSMRS